MTDVLCVTESGSEATARRVVNPMGTLHSLASRNEIPLEKYHDRPPHDTELTDFYTLYVAHTLTVVYITRGGSTTLKNVVSLNRLKAGLLCVAGLP